MLLPAEDPLPYIDNFDDDTGTRVRYTDSTQPLPVVADGVMTLNSQGLDSFGDPPSGGGYALCLALIPGVTGLTAHTPPPLRYWDAPEGALVEFECVGSAPEDDSALPGSNQGHQYSLQFFRPTETSFYSSYFSWWKKDDGTIAAHIFDGDTEVDSEVFSMDFDSVAHRWLSLVLTAGRTHFKWLTSSDGIAWEERYSQPVGAVPITNAFGITVACYSATPLVVTSINAHSLSVDSSSGFALAWDKTGSRIYQAGIDRGVLYLPDGRAVPWNGLTSVEEDFEQEVKRSYLDGTKYLEHQILGDFAGKLKAITYPDEFDECLGIKEYDTGLFLHDQQPSSFGLSYRTLIGNDVDGESHSYRIHILWNLIAVPESVTYQTLAADTTLTEFGWTLTATPEPIPGHRPTAHISVEASALDPELIHELESILYGSDSSLPSLPSLARIFAPFTEIVITDHGDGSWTAEGPLENVFMLAPGVFEIHGVDGTYLDGDTYQISTTELD